MDAFDRSIVRFVLAWAPYGGPHDDAACREFGLDADVIIRRFSAVVTEAVRQTHRTAAPIASCSLGPGRCTSRCAYVRRRKPLS